MREVESIVGIFLSLSSSHLTLTSSSPITLVLQEQCAQYWPSSTDCPEKLGKFTVELIEQNSFDDYLTRDMKLTQAEVS